MTGIISSLSALLLSIAILLSGHGMQLTLAPLFADSLGWQAETIGLIASAYFSGFVVGCLSVPRLVANAGHIRVFIVLICLAVSALLMLGIFQNPWIWALARGITGWAFAGLYMVMESWLNERSGKEHRGRILSIYTIISLAAICAGQFLAAFDAPYQTLIMLGAILMALGALPVGLTRSPMPSPIPLVKFRMTEVYKASHVAVAGTFVGGLVTAGFWSLGPVVARAQGLNGEQISLFMASTILGGTLLQFPLGRLSDTVDRRWVLILVSVLGSVVCGLSFWLSDGTPATTYVLMFFFGGVTFPFYTLCLAHANDNTDLGLMEIASVMLLMNSAGSILGPILVALSLNYSDSGLFLISGIVLALFACWTVWRISTHRVDRTHFEPYVSIPRTSHEVAELANPD
ncbi:MAG: MFS transporter, partial [Gammaproteobacteria bacterium]|nr:MFS transporter [Gammaproteobacteria bacterium]